MNMIEVRDLTKKYGKFTAMDNISFSVEKGSIVGFVGKNGAGKTTTIRCILDFLKPDEGSIKVNNLDSVRESSEIKRFLGYMPSDSSFYDNLACRDIFDLSCRVSGADSEKGRAIKGEDIMSDKEKFEGFKQHLISENEEKYGKEIREKYGNEIIDGANDKIEKMCPEQWQKAQELSLKINENLKSAFETGDPSGETAQKVCELHREWLCMFWPDGTYSKEAHRALAESYVADERFTDYYDRIAAGCTKFLRDAIIVFCK